jgi:sugar-specific transcriptional regulator TrmB
MLKTSVQQEEALEIRKEAEFILKELGFSTYGAQAFISVCGRSPISAGSLCEKTGIPDSKVYYALKEVEDAGLITRIGGTPQLYAAQDPKEISETLGKLLRSRYEKQEKMVCRLERLLGPISESAEKKDSLEIAYIARGFDSVARRLRKMLRSATREIVGYIWDEQIYSVISKDLNDARDRDVKLKLAVNPKFNDRSLPMVSRRKVLSCECNIFVTDNNKMITITRTRDGSYYAIITDDPGIVSLGISYYDNPACCVA